MHSLDQAQKARLSQNKSKTFQYILYVTKLKTKNSNKIKKKMNILLCWKGQSKIISNASILICSLNKEKTDKKL
jgi:hypothetical protein